MQKPNIITVLSLVSAISLWFPWCDNERISESLFTDKGNTLPLKFLQRAQGIEQPPWGSPRLKWSVSRVWQGREETTWKAGGLQTGSRSRCPSPSTEVLQAVDILGKVLNPLGPGDRFCSMQIAMCTKRADLKLSSQRRWWQFTLAYFWWNKISSSTSQMCLRQEVELWLWGQWETLD